MQRTLPVILALGTLSLAGCSSVGSGGAPPAVAAAAEPAAPAIPTGAAQVAALDSGQRRSWRGSHGVFGYVEAGAATGDGCRAYSQTIYIAGRPNRGRGVGCKQPDGSWKMTSGKLRGPGPA